MEEYVKIYIAMTEERSQRPFLKIQDVAELLDLDYKTVYRMVLSGQLPAAKLGGVYRIRREDLDAFFERMKVVGRPSRESVLVMEPTTCARCDQAFRVPSLVGGKCQAAGCDLALCTTCWRNKNNRYCRDHAAEE
jgi:excisionase family DNA binding protein